MYLFFKFLYYILIWHFSVFRRNKADDSGKTKAMS